MVGDKWTLLVVRDLLRGKRTYSELLASPERIPTNLLAERLERLERAGLICSAAYQERPVRYAYTLTDKGKALGDVLKAYVPGGSVTSLERAQSARYNKARGAPYWQALPRGRRLSAAVCPQAVGHRRFDRRPPIVYYENPALPHVPWKAAGLSGSHVQVYADDDHRRRDVASVVIPHLVHDADCLLADLQHRRSER